MLQVGKNIEATTATSFREGENISPKALLIPLPKYQKGFAYVTSPLAVLLLPLDMGGGE